jgi:CheY-like chemotaxis protein
VGKRNQLRTLIEEECPTPKKESKGDFMNDFDQGSPLGGTVWEQTDATLDQRLPKQHTTDLDPVPLGKGELILLVDDDDTWVWIGQRILSSLGYKVIGYTSPVEALSFFRVQPQLFDLVITDLNMPVLDGVTLGAKLLQLRPDLPIILMTSGDGMVTLQGIRQTGFRELLLKPELARILGKSVHDALEVARQGVTPKNDSRLPALPNENDDSPRGSGGV